MSDNDSDFSQYIGGDIDNLLINTNDFINAISEIKIKVVKPLINVKDIPEKLTYRKGGRFAKPSLHLGQRKLFLSELQFLTNHLKNNDDPAYVVYAGAAPSHSKYELISLFPNVKFILVDPAEIKIFISQNKPHYKMPKNNSIHKQICYIRSGYYDANKNIESFEQYNGKGDWNTPKLAKFIKESDFRFYIIEDFYDNEVSINLASLTNDAQVFFWSDIRTNISEDNPKDLDIIWNLCMQYTWSVLLNADNSMYKFRIPYMSDKSHFLENYKNKPFSQSFEYAKTKLPKNKCIDFVENYFSDKLIYPSGDTHIQAYATIAGGESRLIVNMKKCKIIEYDMKQYDNKYYFYNHIFRIFQCVKNPISNKHTGFDHCNDCGLEYSIWYNYYKKYYIVVSNNIISTQVKKITEIMNSNFIYNGHGFLFPSNFKSNKNKNNQLVDYYNEIIKHRDVGRYYRRILRKKGPGILGHNKRRSRSKSIKNRKS